MSGRNGDRKPPRPQIRMLSAPSDSEAAAIVAALEQFIADTAPAPSGDAEPSRWQRAALEEGIAVRQIAGRGWGQPPIAAVARSPGSR